MNCRKALIVVFTAMLTFTANAQIDSFECDKMKFLAGESVVLRDYRTASMYYLKGEISCGEYDQADWDRLLGSLKYVVNEEEDEGIKKIYIDTLLKAWDRQELAGFYKESYDLERGMYIMQSAEPDLAKADMFFQRGIKAKGLETNKAYIVYAYYTTYLMYTDPSVDQKPGLKTRLISDYLFYSEMVDKATISEYTQYVLDTYFSYIFQDCNDLLPEIQGYIQTLPEDTADAIQSIRQMTLLLEEKNCIENNEYDALIDAWLLLDSNSMEAKYSKDASAFNKLTPTEKIDYYKRKTNDPNLKEELQYKKAYIQFKNGQYRAAYNTGLNCTGNYEAKGKYIAAQCVAATAPGCGESTFERKCNYLYAAQLADQAGQGGAAQNYLSKGPSTSSCSLENMQTITLDCWNVTVKYCP